MDNKKVLLTITSFLYTYSSVATSGKAGDIPDEKSGISILSKFYPVKENPMELSYPDEVIREAEGIIGGGSLSSQLRKYALSQDKEKLIAQLNARQITDDDRAVSYALQLLADGTEEDIKERTCLYEFSYLFNPDNEEIVDYILEKAGEGFDARFVELVKTRHPD